LDPFAGRHQSLFAAGRRFGHDVRRTFQFIASKFIQELKEFFGTKVYQRYPAEYPLGESPGPWQTGFAARSAVHGAEAYLALARDSYSGTGVTIDPNTEIAADPRVKGRILRRKLLKKNNRPIWSRRRLPSRCWRGKERTVKLLKADRIKLLDVRTQEEYSILK